jgi:hypothetical protein
MSSGVTGRCPGVQRRGPPRLGAPSKNDHKIFSPSFSYRGPEKLQRWPPKAGIGEIVKFEPPFLVDMDGEKHL